MDLNRYFVKQEVDVRLIVNGSSNSLLASLIDTHSFARDVVDDRERHKIGGG